jgi:hypothetical protein
VKVTTDEKSYLTSSRRTKRKHSQKQLNVHKKRLNEKPLKRQKKKPQRPPLKQL